MTFVHGAERMWVDAKINGKAARLVFDTGSTVGLLVFRPAAERLNLALRAGANRGPDDVPYWLTDECTVRLPWAFWGFARAKTPLIVIEVPSSVNMEKMDGAVGWPIFSERVLQLDASRLKFKFLRKVPDSAAGWTKFTVRTNCSVLALETPKPDGEQIILVDTGSPFGVYLPLRQWREWRAAHTNEPTTLTADWSPLSEWIVTENGRAKKLPVGPLELTDVLVGEDAAPYVRRLPGLAATFGLAALERLELIVDGKHSIAYLQPKKTPGSRRLPANDSRALVFMPAKTGSDTLMARVANLSSASESGVRNGDVLLKLGERDVAMWRTDPGATWHRSYADSPFLTAVTNCPAGAKLELTLNRSGETIKVAVV